MNEQEGKLTILIVFNNIKTIHIIRRQKVYIKICIEAIYNNARAG